MDTILAQRCRFLHLWTYPSIAGERHKISRCRLPAVESVDIGGALVPMCREHAAEVSARRFERVSA